MAKTIIQSIGPLYGEPVNGTVFGRPNGSVFVPITNTVTLALADASRYLKNQGAGIFRTCTSSGSGRNYNIVAVAQDLASNVQVQVFTDAECTTLIGYIDRTAGNFNYGTSDITNTTETTLVSETSYYLRAQLMNNGVPVATSEVIEVTGWVAE